LHVLVVIVDEPLLDEGTLAQWTNLDSLGVSLFANNLDISLPTKWIKEIGLNCLRLVAALDLGSRTISAPFTSWRLHMS
jgi:hypothetical protein